jgi:hypothetical protein
MKKPNLKSCNEEQLWKYVGYHLAEAGIESVLVGGAVVAVYSNGAYRSGDLDFVAVSGMRPKIQSVLEALGFQSMRSRHFEHPECPHLIIEFAPGPLSIGDDFKIKPSEVKVDGRVIKILSPTDCIRDRIASYIHFNARDCLDQAVLVAKSQPFDLERVRKWCMAEGAKEKFEEFRRRLL